MLLLLVHTDDKDVCIVYYLHVSDSITATVMATKYVPMLDALWKLQDQCAFAFTVCYRAMGYLFSMTAVLSKFSNTSGVE